MVKYQMLRFNSRLNYFSKILGYLLGKYLQKSGRDLN